MKRKMHKYGRPMAATILAAAGLMASAATPADTLAAPDGSAITVTYHDDVPACESCERVKASLRQLPATSRLREPDFSSRKACLATLAWAEEHLGNPTDTAMHDEQLYVQVLQRIVQCDLLSDDDKIRPEQLLADAMKNAIGTTAADLGYMTIDGEEHRLQELDSTRATLIYFYDPECSSCNLVRARLDTCTALRRLVEGGKLTVLAIYPYGDGDMWERTPFADYIICGWDTKQEIEEQQTYVLPTMPLFYLLDSNRTVVLKNEPSLNRTLRAVAEVTR